MQSNGLQEQSIQVNQDSIGEAKEHPNQPSVEYLASIVNLSYLYSQGFKEVQADMYEDIKVQHPEWKVVSPDDDPSLVDRVLEDALKKGKPLLQDSEFHRNIPNDALIQEDYRDRVKDLLIILSNPEALPQRIPLIAFTILYSDYKNLFLQKRARVQQVATMSPFTDAFMSQVCYYGYLGNREDNPSGFKAGLPEYTNMFERVYRYLSETPPEVLEEERQRIIRRNIPMPDFRFQQIQGGLERITDRIPVNEALKAVKEHYRETHHLNLQQVQRLG